MIGKKIYLQPGRVVYWGLRDLMDAQNGRESSSDEAGRQLRYTVRMFDMEWSLRFQIRPVDQSRCEASLEVAADNADCLCCPGGEPGEDLDVLADYVLRREYAMLDAMLLIGTPLETTYHTEESAP